MADGLSSVELELRREMEALRIRGRTMSEVTRRITESLDLDTILQEVVDGARALTGARYGAVETMIDRLADDHANAKRLARGLADIPGFDVDPDDVHTNLAFVTTTEELPSGVAESLARRGVMVGDRGNGLWRLVTHNDVSSDDVDHALDLIETTVRELSAA